MNAFKEVYNVARDGEQLKAAIFILLLGVSVSFAFILSFVYVHFSQRRFVNDVNLYKVYPLLALATTSIFASLQFSIPLSLGLLGSLSLVRFRMNIRDPLEIGFVLIIIATSLLAATANFTLLIAVFCFAILVLFIVQRDPFAFISRRMSSGILLINLPAEEYRRREKEILASLKSQDGRGYMDSITERGGSCALAYRFNRMEPDDLIALKEKVGRSAEYSIYYNKEGVLR